MSDEKDERVAHCLKSSHKWRWSIFAIPPPQMQVFVHVEVLVGSGMIQLMPRFLKGCTTLHVPRGSRTVFCALGDAQ